MTLAGTVLRHVLGSGRGYDPYECRRCGRSYESEQATCPECGSRAIVRIKIE